MNYPLYRVSHGIYTPSGVDFYLLEALPNAAPAAQWMAPINFAAAIVQYNLKAAANTIASSAYPNAYLVGTGSGFWATDTSAKAAALSDYATLTSARDTAVASTALAQNFTGNPYILASSDSPVIGPG